MPTTSSIAAALRAVSCAIALVFSASAAHATDRFYRDLRADSPDGHYRLEATSPDNARGGMVPFADNFKYVFTDTRTNKVLWTRQQRAEGEWQPISAWINDAGWAVVWTAQDNLIVVSPTTGKRTGAINILKQFPKDEYDANVHQTTAGPMWSGSSRWYFLNIDGKPHFAIRCSWGRHVIVDLASGSVVADEGKAHDAAVASERADVVDVLRRAAKEAGPRVNPTTGDPDDNSVAVVTTAAHIAGKDQIKEAIPFLLKLEKWDYVGRSSVWPVWLDKPLAEGTVDPFAWSEFSVRARVQTALRRLGIAPAGLPATQFKYCNKDYDQQKPVVVTLNARRADHVDSVKVGMSPLEVLQSISAPDAIVHAGRTQAWEYDIDLAEPFTLCVIWTTSNPPTVSEVARLVPVRWKVADARDNY